jgi:Cd2+/Zn2+-exporting ATPase
LTEGVFEVTGICPSEGFTERGLLERAAMAEAFSSHPIALSILKAYKSNGSGGSEGCNGVDRSRLFGYREIAGHGVGVVIGAGAGGVAGGVAGAEAGAVARGEHVLAGSGRLMASEGVSFTQISQTGTIVYVAVDGRFAGSIAISDVVKRDSRAAIASLKELGVRKIAMLTGDNRKTAEAVAKSLSIDETRAELLPGQKVEAIEALEKQKRAKGKLAFVGDGINDAPVLARADVGVVMGVLGSDAAIEAADVALMTDEPSKLAHAIGIAKATKRIAMQNIAFALGVKSAFLILGALGVSGMWEAVFADMGVAVLAILNAMRVMRVKVLT